jgi:hypothetical protein
MAKLYKYVGSDEIRQKVAGFPVGIQIKSIREPEGWIDKTRQKPNAWGLIVVTFVVDKEGYLRVAARHSEHIACSDGKSVLSAGEIFFAYSDRGLEVAEVSNQSTGFCPESQNLGQRLLQLLINLQFLILIVLPSNLSFAAVLPAVK